MKLEDYHLAIHQAIKCLGYKRKCLGYDINSFIFSNKANQIEIWERLIDGHLILTDVLTYNDQKDHIFDYLALKIEIPTFVTSFCKFELGHGHRIITLKDVSLNETLMLYKIEQESQKLIKLIKKKL